MILKTKEFREATNKILLALDSDKTASNLEIVARGQALYLNVTNKEFYVSIRFNLEAEETFRAVVDASVFLTLISGLTTDEFSLDTKDTTVVVKAGKSSYKLAMIYENENLMTLPVIAIENKTVEMPIKNDILQSILNVNSKEIQKGKNLININELQKLYYVDETGCFTFTTGATLNKFDLEKPVKLLLNDRIVKLFRLFKDDVEFSLGQDKLSDGRVRTKVVFETTDTYVAAIINCDDILLSKVQGPCTATKRFISEAYAHSLVLSVNALSAAVSRLLLFTKTSVDKANMSQVKVNITITPDEFIIKDSLGNCESVPVENGSFVADGYEMALNLSDLKLVLDSCKNEHITLNCGNHRSIVITRANISNLIPEMKAN